MRFKTSAEVWAVIRARHSDDMAVFSSFSAPSGDPHGNMQEGRMMTEYGLKGADYPLMGADTRWEIGNREETIKTDYWLCAPLKESED